MVVRSRPVRTLVCRITASCEHLCTRSLRVCMFAHFVYRSSIPEGYRSSIPEGNPDAKVWGLFTRKRIGRLLKPTLHHTNVCWCLHKPTFHLDTSWKDENYHLCSRERLACGASVFVEFTVRRKSFLLLGWGEQTIWEKKNRNCYRNAWYTHKS